MIEIVDGKQGHGKSSYCATHIKKALQNGVRVYSNMTVYPRKMFSKRRYQKLFGDNEIVGNIAEQKDRDNENIRVLDWQNFSDWQYFKNGLIVCDEGLVYFNARNWENLPDEVRLRLTQQRKDGLDMIVNAQHWSFVDITIRHLAEVYVHCELRFGSPRFGRSLIPRIAQLTFTDLFTLTKAQNMGVDLWHAEREELERLGIKLDREHFWIHEKRFSWYNTAEKLYPSRPVALVHLERTCNSCGAVKISHA